MNNYPAWICSDCGQKYGRVGPLATFHDGDQCGWCDRSVPTTQPRDYGYPPFSAIWHSRDRSEIPEEEVKMIPKWFPIKEFLKAAAVWCLVLAFLAVVVKAILP